MYKYLFVPGTKSSPKMTLVDRIRGAFVSPSKADEPPKTKTLTERVCFTVKGGVGYTIQPQSVLPDMSEFHYDSSGNCPMASDEARSAKCELWKMFTDSGKKNTYKFWVRRDKRTNMTIPVHYYMLGYDTLLGSHYDRYDISYHGFETNGAKDDDFRLDPPNLKCGSMSGPDEGASKGERRSHLIVQNPIHEYVSDPHKYDHIDHEFEKFRNEHQREYDTAEKHGNGWRNFLHNFRFINSKNRELKHYKLGVNRFADDNPIGLKYLRGRLKFSGYNGGLDYAAHHSLRGADGRSNATNLPDYWDWNIRGAVTPVKDQAVCGSCWSFGTVGTIEGAYFVKTGKLPILSQQQLVDCSWKFGNNGCDGGLDFQAYKYVMEAGGISTEEDYGSYLGVDGKCHDRDVERNVKISGFYNVTSDQEALKHAIVTYGPVTIALDASQPTFTFYSHGVYYDEKCKNSPNDLDHQVLAVGYVHMDGKLVWLIKNSWSTYWGDNGYIYMSAENNNCGVLTAPTVPIIKT